MATALTNEQITIIRAGLDASAYQAGGSIIVAMNEKMAQSGAGVVAATGSTTTALVAAGSQAERYRQQIDLNYQAIQKFRDIQTSYNNAVMAGRMEVSTANAGLALYANSLGVAGTAIDRIRAKYDDVYAVSKKYQQALTEISLLETIGSARGGITTPVADVARAKLDAQFAAANQPNISAHLEEAKALDAIRVKYDSLYVATQKYNQALKEINVLQNVGPVAGGIGASVADQARIKAAADLAKATASNTAADDQSIASLNVRRGAIESVFAVSQKYAAGLVEIKAVQKELGLSTEWATAQEERLTAAFAAKNAPMYQGVAIADQYSATQAEIARRATAAAEALIAATNAQAAYNAVGAGSATGTGYRVPVAPAPLSGAARDSRQTDLEAAYGDSLEITRAKYDDLYVAETRHAQALKEIAQLEVLGTQQGGISPATAVDARANAAAALAAANNAGTTAAERNAQAMRDQRAAIDSVYAVSMKYSDQWNAITAVQQKFGLSAAWATQQQANLTAEFSRANGGVEQAGATAGKATNAMDKMSFATAGTTREFIVLGHEILVGNFSRIPGSLMVLAERAGNLGQIVSKAWALFLSPMGLITTAAVAVTAGIVAIAVASENAALRMNALKNTLAPLHDNYVALAQSGTEAAKIIAATTSISTADARPAINEILGSPQWAGTTLDLVALVKAANDVALSFGETVPAAAKTLAAAMSDPTTAYQQMVDKAIKPFNQITADQIRLMQLAGDKAGAFSIYLDTLRVATQHVTENITPLQEALIKLEEAFTKTGQNGRAATDSLGASITKEVAKSIQEITNLINSWDTLYNLATQGHTSSAIIQAMQFVMTGRTPDTTPAPGAGTPAFNPMIAPHLAASAAANQLDPAYLARLQAAEGVWDPKTQTWQTSSTGAQGPMQVLPSTFASVTANPQQYPAAKGLNDNTDPAQNIMTGGAYIRALLDKFKDPSLAVIAYHDGPRAMEEILAGIRNPSPAALKEARDVMRGYTGTGYGPGGPGAAPTAPVAPGLYGPPTLYGPPAPSANQGAGNQTLVADQLKLNAQLNIVADQRATIEAKMTAQRTAIQAANIVGDTAAVDKLSIGYRALDGELARTVSSQEQLLQAQRLQLQVLAPLTEGDRKLVEVKTRMAEQDRLHPESASTDAQKTEAVNNMLLEQSAALAKIVYDTDVNTKAQEKMAAAYAKGGGDVADATARQQAYTTAMSLFPQNSIQAAAAVELLTKKFQGLALMQASASMAKSVFDIQMNTTAQAALAIAYTKGGAAVAEATAKQQAWALAISLFPADSTKAATAVGLLTVEFQRLQVATQNAQVAQSTAANENTITMLKAETAVVGEDNRTRTIRIALLQAELDLKLRDPAATDAYTKKFLQSVADVNAAKYDFSEHQKALGELAGAFGQAMNTIGGGISDLLTGKAVDWVAIAQSIVKQIIDEFLKLAIINPILNQINGNSALTTFSSIAKALGGSTTTTTSGGGIGALGGLAGVGAQVGTSLATNAASTGAQLVGFSIPTAIPLVAIHSGGVVGDPFISSLYRNVPMSTFDSAPRFHSGLGADEFAAVLQRGERVLTAPQQRAVTAAANDTGAASTNTFIINMPNNVTDTDSFRRSMPQVINRTAAALSRATKRSN